MTLEKTIEDGLGPCYKKLATLEEGVSKMMRMLMEEKKEDDMGACIEKLDKIGWAAQDPMYDTALLLFGQSAKYSKLCLHLKPESYGNWVKSVGRKLIITNVSSKLMMFGMTIDAAYLMLLGHKYSLIVNPTIYVSCIKKFLTSVLIKKSNDAVRLKALINKKKVIITEGFVRQSLRLDDADGVDPNEEIFAELTRMGYEKPLIRNMDSPSKFLTYPCFLQLMIKSQVSDLSSHTTKYTSPALIKKVFANIRRVGKGFLGVDTPLFDGMLVPQQVQDVKDVAEDEDDHNEVSAESTLPLPTPVTPLPSPTQEHTCATLTKKVSNLEEDKIAQAIEITKLKQRVRRGKITKLDADKDVTIVDAEEDMDADVHGRLEESQAKVYHLDLEHAEKVLSMQDTNEAELAKVEKVIEVVTAAKLMTEVVTTAATTIIAAQVPKASDPRKRKGVIIHDLEETATASVIVHSEVKSKDKGKGILIKEPKPLKRQAQIKKDETFARQLEAELNANINWNNVVDQVKRKEKQDNTVMRYQALKRKLVTKAQARKNIMVYLKNMAGFKMEFFKGMTYTNIRPIFEKHYNSIQAFLEKGEKVIEEEGSKRKSDSPEQKAAKKQRIDEEEEELKAHLQIVVNDDDNVFTEATPLALKVLVVDYQIYHENNKPYYKIIRANETHKLFLSFITILKNFDREDLEML
uniref:L10-interacting MYB domain-containing protein-like n=1 Tax=Tanacetum cinerariifolium TaxID=118510 RepID=A0A6L2MVB9_TANCI|nr:L10-interacting MYB domain-containing protein-like [Tanacetum cinerariifolium]